MHHASIRGDVARGDGPPLRKPRARLMLSGGSAGGATGGPCTRRPSKVDDKPVSHSPPVSRSHLTAQAVHTHPPPRRSTSFNAKPGSLVNRTGEHSGRPVRLALSGGHGGHHGSPKTLVADHTSAAAQTANWDSPCPPQQQQQQQQQFEGSQGASGDVSVASLHTPRSISIRPPPENVGADSKQQRQEVIALSPEAQELFGISNGPDNGGGPQTPIAAAAMASMTSHRESEEHETDTCRRLLEQLGAERSARVRDCTKIHVTLDELRGRLASGLCEAEEAVEARLVARLLTELTNHSTERMSEQVALEVHRHIDGAIAQITSAAVQDLEGRFLSAEVIQNLEERLPSAIAVNDVEKRLATVEKHNSGDAFCSSQIMSDMHKAIAAADARSLEQFHAFRTEYVELCRDICSDMLQQSEAQSEACVAKALHKQVQLGLGEVLGATEARLRSEIEAAGTDEQLLCRIAAVEALCGEGQREMEARIQQQYDLLHLEVQEVSAASEVAGQAFAVANRCKDQIEKSFVDLQAKLAEHQERSHEVKSAVQVLAGDTAVLKEQGALISALHRDVSVLQASAADTAELLRQTQHELETVKQNSLVDMETAQGNHANFVESHTAKLSHLEAAHSHHANAAESHKAQLDHLEAAHSRHTSVVESHGSKLSSLEAAHGQYANMVESHSAQLSELATVQGEHLSLAETHGEQLRHLEAGHGHTTALVQSHSTHLHSLEDSHSHLTNIMDSHKAQLSSLEDRHASAVEFHKQHICDLQAAHGRHAITLESLHHQVDAARNIERLVSGLCADMDVIRHQQQESNCSPHDSDAFTGRFQEQTALIDELRSKVNKLEVSSAESAELHKSWKASHQELLQAHTTRANALEDSHFQHRGDLEELRGQVKLWQNLDKRMECLLSDVEALKQGPPAGSHPEVMSQLEAHSLVVTTLNNDFQGMEKFMHNLKAEVQAFVELALQAKEGNDSQESNGQSLQIAEIAEKLEALTCLMSASREELDILRTKLAEDGDLFVELGALRLLFSQVSGAGAKLESVQAAIDRQQGAMEAVLRQVSSIMSELDAMKDQQPGDPACHHRDLHAFVEEHMATFASFRNELDALKAGAADSVALHSSWCEASKEISAAEERHAACLIKETEAAADMTETFATVETAPESTREGQAEAFSSDEDGWELQRLAAELHQKLDLGIEQLRIELVAEARRMELQFGQELPEHWNVMFSAHERMFTSMRGELEDIKAVQEQGLQASAAADELLIVLEGAKEVVGLQEDNLHAATWLSVTGEEKSKGDAVTSAAIASLRSECGSLKAAQDLQSHDLKVLENAVTGHFEDMRAMFGHVEESVQQLHCKMDRSDTTDMGHRISAMEQIRQEDRAAVDVMMAEQRRRENLLTEAGACISRLCRFKDKLVIGPAQDGDASEASASEGGLASVSV